MKKEAFQDGPDFYDCAGGHIISYPALVKNDSDLEGAIEARKIFLLNHPHYQMCADPFAAPPPH